MFGPNVSRVVLALFAFSALATAADAGLLVDFKPDPSSSTLYEVGWTGTQIVQRPGSVGNGDGALSPTSQIPGGMNIQTPLNIVGITGSTNNSTDGSTTFYDVTLELTGLLASAAPIQTPIMPGMVVVSQPVGTGTFTLLSTNKDALGNSIAPTVLLTGTIADAVVSGLLGSTTGSIWSENVTFTGGVLNSISSTASLSWSLLDIGGGLKVVSGGFGTTLQSFDANMTGQITPEPATLCLLGIGVATVLATRRKK